MKIKASLVAAFLVFLVPSLASAAPPGVLKVLTFDTMFGVEGPFLGSANPIRGVNGGGLPWVLDHVEGQLRGDGRLFIEVDGLIIPASVPGFGFNPVAFFRAIVSCETVDGVGNVTVSNVTTTNGAEVMVGDPRDGNAVIRATLALPSPCVAPIVFVTSPTGAWFAATGR